MQTIQDRLCDLTPCWNAFNEGSQNMQLDLTMWSCSASKLLLQALIEARNTTDGDEADFDGLIKEVESLILDRWRARNASAIEEVFKQNTV